MQRVHRNLSRDDVESLRNELVSLVPRARADISQLMRTMRLITRKSQIEYAKLCEVAPRVLADIEAGKGSPTVETLEKLLRPFGYRVGIVAPIEENSDAEPSPSRGVAGNGTS
jgi:XRE family transcriptional regulator, regulator of sulfur utilization